jgi:hypothetical protein
MCGENSIRKSLNAVAYMISIAMEEREFYNIDIIRIMNPLTEHN